MIRFGLRLTLTGKEAVVRLLITAAAVALGVGMLLITLAGINAVNAQNARYAWLETGAGESNLAATSTSAAAKDPVWWLLTADMFQGQIIGRVDVAATGAHSPVPPGIGHLPGPGDYYASPALSDLLRSTPDAQLGARFPGRQIGTIGPAALPAPDSLIIIIGRRVGQLSNVEGAHAVTSISTTVPSSCAGPTCFAIGIDAAGIDLILSIAAAALLFPVLIFIGSAARLSAARREERFAAMRLVGATPRQISLISVVESSVAAVLGVVMGFGLFYLLRPALAKIPFTGSPFFLSDLSLNRTDILVIALGIPVAAAGAARLALRRVQISPLGVSRRVTPRPPRAYRLIPLVAGLGELAFFVAAGRPGSTPGQIEAFLPGLVVVMAGLVIAGPWLTMASSRIMARRTSRPAVLIAGRRLSDNPKAGFRSISGLVMALFVTSVAIGLITTLDAYNRGPASGKAGRATLVDQFNTFRPSGPTSIPQIPPKVLTKLHAIPGVRAITVIHAASGINAVTLIHGAIHRRIHLIAPPSGVVSCAQLARTPALGHCPPSTNAVAVSPMFAGRDANGPDTVWPAVTVPPKRLHSRPVEFIVVATNGSARPIEQSRTILEGAYPYLYSPATIAEDMAQNPNTKLDAQYQQLADVVILSSLLIAGSSLAVSVVAGLSERKRPFSLLRLTGASLGMLQRVVALESVVPLIVVAVLSSATGFLAAGLFARSQLGESLHAPGAGYYAIVLTGLLFSLAVIASTLPLLRRITGPETARND